MAEPHIPVILNFDVEPDEIHVNRKNPRPWSGFEFTHNYLKDFRSRFEDASGHPVHFNWFLRMDPQIAMSYGSSTWVTDRYGSIFAEYQSLGDEIGLHVHTYRWSEQRDRWIDDCGTPDWVSECLQRSVEGFRQAFGHSSRILRFGNYWVSTRAINEAEALGIRYDLTVEPGRKSVRFADKSLQSGPTPNFFGVPRAPYTPSRSDFGKPEKGGNQRSILMLPLTSAYLRGGWGVQGMKHRIARLVRNGIRDRFQSTPLQMAAQWKGPDNYNAMLDRAIEVQERPYLAFAVRSYLNGKDFPYTDSSLTALLKHQAGSRFRFCTPAEAIELLNPGGQTEDCGQQSKDCPDPA